MVGGGFVELHCWARIILFVAAESPLGAIVTRDVSHPSGRRVGVGDAWVGDAWLRCVSQYAKIESDFLLRFVCWGRSFINIQVKKRGKIS